MKINVPQSIICGDEWAWLYPAPLRSSSRFADYNMPLNCLFRRMRNSFPTYNWMRRGALYISRLGHHGHAKSRRKSCLSYGRNFVNVEDCGLDICFVKKEAAIGIAREIEERIKWRILSQIRLKLWRFSQNFQFNRFIIFDDEEFFELVIHSSH